jgi:hypothetical protein
MQVDGMEEVMITLPPSHPHYCEFITAHPLPYLKLHARASGFLFGFLTLEDGTDMLP